LLWSPVRRIYTIFIVLVGWCFFRAETLPYALTYLKAMFGFGSHTHQLNNILIYLTPDVIIVLVLGIIGSMPIFDYLKNFMSNKLTFGRPFSNNILSVFEAGFSVTFFAVVFFLCVMYLASGTYNPFIYFRF